MEPKIDFVDAESDYGLHTKEEITFQSIILRYLNKICNLSAVEFRGGFYMQVDSKTGVKEVYVSDTREMYCNAVECLFNMLFPHFDKDMGKAGENIEKDLKKIQDAFIKISTPEEKVILGEGFYNEEKDKIALEEYRQTKLQLFLILFRNLSSFLHRKNYLKVMAIKD